MGEQLLSQDSSAEKAHPNKTKKPQNISQTKQRVLTVVRDAQHHFSIFSRIFSRNFLKEIFSQDTIFSRTGQQRCSPDTFPPQVSESQCHHSQKSTSIPRIRWIFPPLTGFEHRTMFNTHQEMNKGDGKPQAEPCLKALHFVLFQTWWCTGSHWKAPPSGSRTWWIKYPLALTCTTEGIKILWVKLSQEDKKSFFLKIVLSCPTLIRKIFFSPPLLSENRLIISFCFVVLVFTFAWSQSLDMKGFSDASTAVSSVIYIYI